MNISYVRKWEGMGQLGVPRAICSTPRCKNCASTPLWNHKAPSQDLAFPFIGHVVQVAEPGSINLQNEGSSTYYVKQLLKSIRKLTT